MIRRHARHPAARLVGLFLLAAAAFVLFRYTPVAGLLDETKVAAALSKMGWLAYPLWVIAYGVLLASWVPGVLMTAIGAAVFGAAGAVPLNYLGAVLGAVLGYVIARALGGDALMSVLSSRWPGYARYEKLLRERGFETVFYLRLVPTPYNLLSYLAGLSPLSLGRYTAATAIGILPGSIAFTYLFGVLLEVYRGADPSALVAPRTLIAAGGYALAAAIPLGLSWLRRRYGWFSKLAAEADPAPAGREC